MYRRRHWEALRATGRRRFVWGVGVLGWGVVNALLWAVTFELVRGGFLRQSFSLAGWLKILATALVLFPAGGYLWGVWVWKIMDRRRIHADRRRSMQQQSTERRQATRRRGR